MSKTKKELEKEVQEWRETAEFHRMSEQELLRKVSIVETERDCCEEDLELLKEYIVGQNMLMRTLAGTIVFLIIMIMLAIFLYV